MRIGSYEVAGKASYGVATEDGIVDLGRRLGARYPDLLALLRAGALAEAERAASGQAADVAADEVAFLPLFDRPVNCFCAGVNYLDHIAETGRERPAFPTLFMKTRQALVGHGQALVRPRASERFDFEGELAAVVGRAGRGIAPERWREHVAGFTVFMDGSVRDFQQRSTDQGKNFWRSSACGPWLTTLDAAPDFAEMTIETRLNGEVMQHSTLDQLCFGVAELLSYYSTIARIEPGDIIATGTPGGVGSRRTPPVWMKPGDVIEVEIAGIGLLRNPIVDEG